ncbi:MAG: acetoin utilization protein AcuC, partial [Planctomycetes bacterium]|nr:acetoin utilization protein AcuC [Planctomycetota bacterium]
MDTTRAAFIHSSELEKYPYPPTCPFDTSRAGKARSMLASMGLLGGPARREVAPRRAGKAQLLTFHTERYLDILRAAAAGQLDEEGLAMGLGTDDTPLFNGLYEYATLAAGATLAGAELLLAGEVDVAFNPSGGYHHARAARAAGFCYINDVAIGILRLVAAGRRVLYLDLDAHHGDGVQEAFYDRRDVMTISCHESGRTLYPGTGFEEETGSPEAAGYAVNVPLPAGTYDGA